MGFAAWGPVHLRKLTPLQWPVLHWWILWNEVYPRAQKCICQARTNQQINKQTTGWTNQWTKNEWMNEWSNKVVIHVWNIPFWPQMWSWKVVWRSIINLQIYVDPLVAHKMNRRSKWWFPAIHLLVTLICFHEIFNRRQIGSICQKLQDRFTSKSATITTDCSLHTVCVKETHI